MTLMLAIIGALLYRGRLKGFFIGLGVVALLLAMGGYTVLHGWLFATTPGFDQLRAPARFIVLLDFSLADFGRFWPEPTPSAASTKTVRAILSKLLKDPDMGVWEG